MSEKEILKIRNREWKREELLSLEPEILRSLIHERTHHTIEVFLYQILKDKRKPPVNFGSEVRSLLEIWREKGLPSDDADFRWSQKYLGFADLIVSGGRPSLEETEPQPFSESEMAAVDKLLFKRRSIRQWKDRKVPRWMVEKIIEAGLAAPNACNMQCQRFLVLDDPESMTIIKSDVPLPPLKIVICQDMRIYEWMDFPKNAPQNIYFDAAAAADHMVLMAHALGLGGVWLTHTKRQADKLREFLGLPDFYRMDTQIAVGWPDEAPVKSSRIPVARAVLNPQNRARG